MSIPALISFLSCIFCCIFIFFIVIILSLFLLFYYYFIVLLLLLSWKGRLQGGITCCPFLCVGLQSLANALKLLHHFPQKLYGLDTCD